MLVNYEARKYFRSLRITFNTRLIARLPQKRKSITLFAKIVWTKLISFEIWHSHTGHWWICSSLLWCYTVSSGKQ